MAVAKYLFKNFYSVIEHHAKKKPRKKVIFEDKDKIKYSEFKSAIDRVSGYLYKLGIRKEDKVGILLKNSKEFLYSFFAIQKLGAIPVPINTFLKPHEIEHILNHSEAKYLITEKEFQKRIKEIKDLQYLQGIIWKDLETSDGISWKEVIENKEYLDKKEETNLEDVAVILYTSGTTGVPKGVMLTYKNLISNVENIAFLGKVSDKDRFIVYLPMFHTFTLTATILLPIYLGGSIVIIRSVFPFSNVLKQVLLRRVTIFLGVPEVYNALSKAKLPWYFRFFHKIKYFVSGGAPLPKATLQRMKKLFPKTPLLEGYGLTECSPVVSINRPEKPKPLSVGPPLPDYKVKIVDDNLNELKVGEIGEIAVKGDNVMKGYYKNPEATAEVIKDGWLLTGDMGCVDEEGYIYIVDRKKDLIISKGINIYPRDIEEVLNKHPMIEVSAVVGKKDPVAGEVPVAFVVLKDGVDKSEFKEREIKKYLKQYLADYKIPKHFIVIDEMPRNATGKILKRELKKMLERGDFGELK
jgi:long-chain acyl-CoA synthetase